MTDRLRSALVEAVTTAFRPRDPFSGRPTAAPEWHDLGAEGRLEAFDAIAELRALEAALDPDGLSTTARAVLSRLV